MPPCKPSADLPLSGVTPVNDPTLVVTQKRPV